MGCHPKLAGAKSLSGEWPSRALLKLGQHMGGERSMHLHRYIPICILSPYLCEAYSIRYLLRIQHPLLLMLLSYIVKFYYRMLASLPTNNIFLSTIFKLKSTVYSGALLLVLFSLGEKKNSCQSLFVDTMAHEYSMWTRGFAHAAQSIKLFLWGLPSYKELLVSYTGW